MGSSALPKSTGLTSTTSSINHLTRTSTPHTSAVNTSIFGALGRSRKQRISAVEQHNDTTLPTTGRGDITDKPENVSKQSWGLADKLVVGTTIMQLPAMIAQTVVEWHKGTKMAEVQK